MKIATLLLLIVPSIVSHAQSISQEVVGSCGDYFSSATAYWCWSLGEVEIATQEGSFSFLTQGFHQPEESTIGVSELSATEFFAYPNPTDEDFMIQGNFQHCQIRMFSGQGEIVYESILNAERLHVIGMSKLSCGLYTLQIISLPNQTTQNIKVQKI